jgi:hypothetical protein
MEPNLTTVPELQGKLNDLAENAQRLEDRLPAGNHRSGCWRSDGFRAASIVLFLAIPSFRLEWELKIDGGSSVA